MVIWIVTLVLSCRGDGWLWSYASIKSLSTAFSIEKAEASSVNISTKALEVGQGRSLELPACFGCAACDVIM